MNFKMSKQAWGAALGLVAYGAFVVVFREQAETFLVQVLSTIGSVL